MAAPEASPEQAIRVALGSDDAEGAVTLIVRSYGEEVLRFLAALLHDPATAADLFGEVCERLWKSIGSFRGDSSARTWTYAIARHVFRDHLRRKATQRKREVRLATEKIANVQAQVSTRTLSYLKTETKDRFAELRQKLPVDEQTLLILRVDRKLPWNDVTTVLNDGTPLEETAAKKRTAALRKRFERIALKLRELASAEGLI